MSYSTEVCRLAYNITKPPNISAINKFGGFDIEYDRLAIIDGEADPWRYATPHAPAAGHRRNTIQKPFIQIKGAVHHCKQADKKTNETQQLTYSGDENGLFRNETTKDLPPGPVKHAQEQIVNFVVSWLEDE
jgi:hypothetical protein